MTKKFSVSELKAARCSQSDFARLVGLTRGRIWQLIRDGLIIADSDGVLVAESMKRFYAYYMMKNYVDCSPTAEYFQKHVARL